MCVSDVMALQLLKMVVDTAADNIEHLHPEVAAEQLKRAGQIIASAVAMNAQLLHLGEVIDECRE